MDETSWPAGFWIRVVAALVDGAVFFFVQASYGYIAGAFFRVGLSDAWTLAPMLWVFTLIFACFYTAVLHSLGGQTIGKMVTRIRVVGADGEPPTLGVGVLRYLGYFVSLATFGLGYLMAGLRRDKRALHDLIAGTRVERLASRRPPLAEPIPEPVDEPREAESASVSPPPIRPTP